MIEQLQPLFNWLQANPHWAGLLVFLVAFSESIALVGLIVPGAMVMTAIGALVGANVLSFSDTMIWSAFGAFLGDWLSYGCGRYFKLRVREMWPFSRYPQWLDKGIHFFHKHGGKSVFFGRFVGPVRPVIPLLAGMMKMPQSRFLLAAIPAGILWAPVYLIPGMFLGVLASRIAPGVATEFVVGVILLAIVIWVFFLAIRTVYRRCVLLIKRFLDHVWQLPAYQVFINKIRDPLYPNSAHQLGLLIAFIIYLLLFILWTLSVSQHGIATAIDNPLYYIFRTLYDPMALSIMMAITFVGKVYVLIPVTGLLFLYFAYQKDFWTAWHFAIMMFVITGIMILFKELSFSARPPGLSELLDGSSYPSAHVAISMAFFAFLAAIFSRRLNKAHSGLIYICATVIVFLIAVSRLYVGAHWLSDVVAGLLLGSTVYYATLLSYHRKQIVARSALPTLLMTVASFLVCWGIYMAVDYRQAITAHQPKITEKQQPLSNWWQQTPPQLYPVTDRLGGVTGMMQLQWAGDLATIEEYLATHEWQPVTWKERVQEYFNNIMLQVPKARLPLSQRFYAEQPPILSVYKEDAKGLLILNLWQSHITLTPGNTPLWLGDIQFLPNEIKLRWLLKRNSNKMNKSYPVLTSIKADLPAEQWRQVVYNLPQQNSNAILLIQQPGLSE